MEPGAGSQKRVLRRSAAPNRRPRRSPVKLVPFDRLKLKSREEDTGISMWQGEKGTYVLEPTGNLEVNRPLARVYLNRKYLTGLFTGKRPDEFSGDMKEVDRKRYLLFHKLDPETLEVLEKVRVPSVAA